MKLLRLEMFGFKSFADRVAIDFNPGITAIVGPNGCGKSNISDAIRWVLGEQRPTLVRGSKMEEVIFNGSRERKPISLAEVTLHFSNADGQLPVQYAEVAVTRRVFRDGTSDYLLNRQLCRLRDIQDLFLGTGVGTTGYSLIQQGMVDSILSDKAEERRYLFEEAAGVTRYKTRRRAAERKLEATAQDLLRVEDIVGEVDKAVTSLRRQVGRTRRYRAYEAEERRLDLHAIALELGALAVQEAPLAAELRALADAEAAQATGLGEREALGETLERELQTGREVEHAARAEADAERGRIARREESQLVTGETLRQGTLRLEALAAEETRAGQQAAAIAARQAELEAVRDAAAARLAAVVDRLTSAGGGAEDDAEASLKVERGTLIVTVEDGQERLAEAQAAAARQASAADGAAERLLELDAALAAMRAEAEANAATAAATATAVARAEAEQDAAAGRAGACRGAQAAAAEALAAARDRWTEERAAEQAAAGRHEALAALEARFEGYGEGAQALLVAGAESAAGAAAGLAGALPRAVEPSEPRLEAALERYLDSLGNGLLARDRAAAVAGADWLAEAGAARADFLIPEFLDRDPAPGLPDAVEDLLVARGRDALRWTGEPSLAPEWLALFDRLLVVRDRAAAFRCRDRLAADPHAARFYVIAGLDGTLLEPSGRWRTPGPDGAQGLLARRRRLSEAEMELTDRRDRVAAAAATLASAQADLEAAEGQLVAAIAGAEAADAAWQTARAATVVAEEAVAQAARRVAELQRRREAEAEAGHRAREAGTRLAAIAEGLAADVARAKARLADVREALERHDAVRAERLSARHAAELEHSEAESARRAIERELEHQSAAAEALTAAGAERAAERARLTEAEGRLTAERAATASEIAALHAALDTIERRARDAGEALREREARRAALDAELRTLRRAHDETLERRHHAALARQELEHRRGVLRAHLEDGSDGGTEASLEERLTAHPLADEEQGLPLEALRERLDDVRRRRASLGPVNMLALEEFERESARLEFLTGQRDDLVVATRQLEEAIRRINATARELFVETFEQVRSHLDSTFRTLFEGGHADIVLADPDDPLESAIEIIASPRGKRVQHISLLSGGERALTALSLLFAIYQVKPSPFCILDEVDAPLDDANVSRFLTMIRHFSAATQFVIVTHNKRTMAAADYLYGITMEEPGVSALVSVALGIAEPATPEPAAPEANGHVGALDTAPIAARNGFEDVEVAEEPAWIAG
ncbi:MAG: chromosome segregation protein SMC [Gemmatimonadota bacterium]